MPNGFDPQYSATEQHAARVRAYQAAQQRAATIDAPKVQARTLEQVGHKILCAECPKCGVTACLSGPGKHLCRACNLIFEMVG